MVTVKIPQKYMHTPDRRPCCYSDLEQVLQGQEKVTNRRKYVEYQEGAVGDGLLVHGWPQQPELLTDIVWRVDEPVSRLVQFPSFILARFDSAGGVAPRTAGQ